jgi:hypothetical protein
MGYQQHYITSNETSEKMAMLEDRCRLLNEVVALRQERDALLFSRTSSGRYNMGYPSPLPPPPPQTIFRTHTPIQKPMIIPSYPHEYGHYEFYIGERVDSMPSAQQQQQQQVSPPPYDAMQQEYFSSPTSSWTTQAVNYHKLNGEERKATITPTMISSSSSVESSTKEKENKKPTKSITNGFPQQKRRLPQNFRLTANTVVLGKGKTPKEASGNMRLKDLVTEYLDEYAASGRQGKMAVISRVVTQIQEENHQGNNNDDSRPAFVRFEDGYWWGVTEKECRVKVTATFRDFLSDNYRSSSRSKVEYRRKQREQQKEVSDFETAVMALNSLMKTH